jgi:hypothetical protein
MYPKERDQATRDRHHRVDKDATVIGLGHRHGTGFPLQQLAFWQLTLYDIMYPKERYDAEINRLKLLQREASAVPF